MNVRGTLKRGAFETGRKYKLSNLLVPENFVMRNVTALRAPTRLLAMVTSMEFFVDPRKGT